MNLHWTAIRSLNGSQAAGFEELCAQLARAEIPAGAKFERKGAPDAGVECFSVLSDGSEWGWQAKVLTALGDSQFDQLDRSVKTALSKHPSLTPPIQGDASSGNGWVQPGDLLERLELTWTGRGADFVDRESNLAVFDPTAHEDGPNRAPCARRPGEALLERIRHGAVLDGSRREADHRS